MDDVTADSAPDATHVWLAPGEPPNGSRWTCCRNCGAVKRADGKPDSACPGVVKVSLRDSAPDAILSASDVSYRIDQGFDLAGVRRSHEALRRRLADTEAAVVRRIGECSQWEARARDAEAEHSEMWTRGRSYGQAVSDLRAERAERRAEAAEVRVTALVAERDAAEERADRNATAVDAAEARVAELTARVGELETALREILAIPFDFNRSAHADACEIARAVLGGGTER